MSNVEIALIVVACVAPILALILILPKHIKKAKTKAEPKVEQSAPAKEEEPTPPPPTAPREIPNYNTDEFRGYLNKRKERATKPTLNEIDPSDLPSLEGYYPRRSFATAQPKKSQTLCEEIQNLSPELKALIFSGALNKQDFENK